MLGNAGGRASLLFLWIRKMIFLTFVMFGFLAFLAADVLTTPGSVDPNGFPDDFPVDEEARDMFGNLHIGDA